MRRAFVLLAGVGLLIGGVPGRAQTITNLLQLTQALASERQAYRDVELEATVCAASRPEVGVLIVRDETGVELLELGTLDGKLQPGERIRLQAQNAFLRRRDLGVEITRAPTVNNDGAHLPQTAEGRVELRGGRVPLRLDWFNCLRELSLEISWAASNDPPRPIAADRLWHVVADETGHTRWLPGLRADAYEGYWETVPDFSLLQPVRSGAVGNFDTGFRTRDEMVGIRFSGFLDVPADGLYTFRVLSDDGAVLFVGPRELPVVRAGFTDPPAPKPAVYGDEMTGPAERRWAEIEGRVTFVTRQGAGLEFDLRSDRDVISVRVADAEGLTPARLSNARVKVRGVAQGVLTTDRRRVLGRLVAAGAGDVAFSDEPSLPLASIGAVQGLPIEEARRELPVSIRGVVTDAKNAPNERWMSIQDDSRGIFVSLLNVSNTPAFGEAWQVEGHSGAGDFAPVIVASNLTFLGAGRLPEPVRPTWNELASGSRDVQWAELAGLVTAVRSNTVTMLLPEGQLDVLMDGRFESELKPFDQCVVRLRGVLYAIWDAATREVRVGHAMMRNANLHVDIPAPDDPFDAVLKTPRELLLFDAQASPFRRVKVRGQIVYADATQLFLQQDGVGLRLLPAEQTEAQPGDLVEAVGYPEIGKTTRLLRQTRVRRSGHAALPAARLLNETELTTEGLDSTRVRVEGKLLGWHFEQGAPVLEMQSGPLLYLALVRPGRAREFRLLRPGSQLALDGVYVSRGRQRPSAEAESFELLLNSPADITVVSQPSWWTLQRLLIVVGSLLVALVFVLIWNRQLQRLVEQRTAQLQRETRERERIERQHALEAERSRIARDLHDDLGSSLTEISALAGTGLRPSPAEHNRAALFQAIAEKARKLIVALDEIVWAIDPEDNTLQSLADYLSGYAAEFFAHTNISCRFKVPMSLPPVRVEGRVRHDLLMAVKEALNNIARHAQATEAEFRMAVTHGALEIEIADNGKGFDGDPEGNGHGLKNLSARLKNAGGDCGVQSRPGGGATVRIRLPLPPTPAAPTTAGN